MNSNQIYDSARELISQGDTDQALQVLISFLEKEGTNADTLHTLRVVEANFSAARKKEAKGILDFSEAQREYAKINDALITLLDDLIIGRKPSIGLKSTGDGRSRPVWFPWLVGGGIVLLLGIATGMWYVRNKTPDEISRPLDCPKFRPQEFRIMVLEFQKLSGEDSKPELGIQSRIRKLTESNQLPADVKILSEMAFGGETPDLTDARVLGSQCMADMIIWGSYEKATDSIEVDIQYAFVVPEWPAGAAMETFKNISEIKSDQMKISNLDEAVFHLCSALALRVNRLDLAKKWLNKLQQPNAREIGWKKILDKK
ncbi:MAG: hypothetical protein ACKVT2_01260 [Saprospiraceae bacterium]